jgi:hypothetical protein
MIMPNNKKRHSTLINRAVVTDGAGVGGGMVIGRITACEPPACKMLLKIYYQNIEIDRMNTYIISKSKQHHQCYAACFARQFGCLIFTPQLMCW